MRATGTLLAAGLAACAGGWLVWTGWRRPTPRLASTIEHLNAADPAFERDATAGEGDDGGGSIAAIGRVVLGLVGRPRVAAWSEPLRLIRRSVDVHVGLLVTAAAVGLVGPALALAVAVRLGAPLGLAVPAAASLICALLAPLTVHSDAVRRAAEVRVDLRHQLAAYLDMVAMLLAGNTGHEGALEQASRAGDGLLFRELRRRIREVATTGKSLVVALSLVADDYGLVELEQVAATTSLSAAEGAPVVRTLSAKCATLRATLAGEEETAARIRNDKVTPPLVGMALLFMALIIYPALSLR